MGCVSSKGDINDLHPNIFQVRNVDESLQPMNPGQIEITDTDLVLHPRGKASMKWPLCSLRKYGFDSEIFSFECGRRCATGPAIFAFRCRRAEQLFNLLQHNIQLRNLSEEVNINLSELMVPVRPIQRRHDGSYLNPTNNATIRPTLSRPGSLTSNGPTSPVSVSTPPMEHNNNSLVETLQEENAPAYINLNANSELLADNSHLYMNVNTETIDVDHLVGDEDPRHNYANINTGAVDDHQRSSSLNLVTSTVPPPMLLPSEVNYVELDLEPGRSSSSQVSQPPPDSPLRIESYVTIDFVRSNALSQSINHRNDNVEESTISRRTRHNSTISDVRHSNSISD